MKHRNDGTRALAVAVLFSLIAFTTPWAVASEGTTALRGIVLDSTDKLPVEGVQILVGSSSNRAIAVSEPTAADGSFAVTGLQPGTYQVGVRSDHLMFVVDTPVNLTSGANRPVDLLIDGGQLSAAVDSRSELPTAKSLSGSGGVWDNPLTATLLVIGGAVVVGVIVDELDSDSKNNTPLASPF